MASTPLELRIVEALEAKAAGHGIDVVDVEVVGAKRAPIVRVRIDHADEDRPTITLDEVSAQSGWVSEAMDELDPFPDSFVLEVSSPGLARPLRRERDFVRFAGQVVRLSTTATEGRRRYTGTLLGVEGGAVRLACDGETVAIPFGEVRSCKIQPSFDA
ncbi:MAG: ribosome maturation factor RimP [Acidobacteriota bacterium]|nr:ribosome maturation factor RimP [Acidobacteriota bacterium]